jgi:hypothetical protein
MPDIEAKDARAVPALIAGIGTARRAFCAPCRHRCPAPAGPVAR